MAVSSLSRTDWGYAQVRPVDRYFLGADLGQSSDPTAICVMHHRVVPLNVGRGDLWRPDEACRLWRQQSTTHFDIRHLERLPLGTPYPAQVAHVAALLQRPPLRDACTLVIDETGVGRPVGDLMDQAGLYPHRITITAGLEATQHGGRTYHVPKALLVSTLEARMHCGELKIASAITEAGVLAEELKDFQRTVSAAGRSTYAARAGKHDDLVLSIAITLWLAANENTVTRSPLRL